MGFEVILLLAAYEFIESLPLKMQIKVYRTIDLLREFGFRLPDPYSKMIKGASKLKELRAKLATDICRLFYFHHRDRIYVITSGYVKKKDKLDQDEINRALRIMEAYLKENAT